MTRFGRPDNFFHAPHYLIGTIATGILAIERFLHLGAEPLVIRFGILIVGNSDSMGSLVMGERLGYFKQLTSIAEYA